MRDWTEVSTIGDCLVRAAAADPTGLAVVIPPDRLTYQQLHQGAAQLARGLLALGVTAGDRVGILMPNCRAAVETFFGAALIGAVAVPVNTRATPGELAHLISHAGLAAVVTTDGTPEKTDFAAVVRAAVALVPADRPRLILLDSAPRSGFVSEPALAEIAAAIPPALVDEYRHRVRIRDLTVLLYTSGTTARPKGCRHSHESLVRTGAARIRERTGGAAHTVLWTPCPLFHVGALVPLIGCVATGSPFVSQRRFDAGPALELLRSEGVTTALPLFAAFTDALLALPEFAVPPTLRQVLTTGSRATVERAQAAFAPAALLSAYGMTEMCGVATLSAPADGPVERVEWDGVPLRGVQVEVRAAGRAGAAPAGVSGEIVVRGYPVFDGYFRDPNATSAAFDADGWFHTGDLGVRDGVGRIAFRGRLRDMLKVGGENVAAMEVEDVVSLHPAVSQVAVVGVADPRLDEVPVAFVSLAAGASLEPAELRAFCRERVASFRVPRHVVVIGAQEWPMSATKVDKVALRNWAAARFTPAEEKA